ncbi:MAG: HAD family phosphatase [Nanoarchaeota archaeon]
MIKGIIFDKDGVLFDSEPVYAKIIIDSLRKFGHEFTEEQYFEHWTRNGGNMEEFFHINNIKIDTTEFRRMIDKSLNNEFRTNLSIIKGVPEALEVLNKLYPLALATASDRLSTDLKLGLSGFGKFFKHIVTKEDVVKRKPDPECFLLAAKKLEIKPSNLVVIEDAEKGVIAAHRAGMKCVAIPTRHTVNHDFSLAQHVLKDINQLTPSLIKAL